ncbi:MAG: hypothetical protein QNJ46_34855 [Leptolyngbyaceae cyanobacterium MO_188.B28]|nr:hypothetical protein [Leptolyngbyaceae cyanobacterium MO_188.B28]
MKFLFIDELASKDMVNLSLLSPAAVLSPNPSYMKSAHSQNSDRSDSNTFNMVDGLIVALIAFYIILGACFLAPMYFTTHFVFGLIKRSDSKPTSGTSHHGKNDILTGQGSVSSDPHCRVS